MNIELDFLANLGLAWIISLGLDHAISNESDGESKFRMTLYVITGLCSLSLSSPFKSCPEAGRYSRASKQAHV